MKKSSEEMRQHIIDVARLLMTQKGYGGVGLGEILSVAGVPKGSFYHYFKSKEEFGEALLEYYFAEYLSRAIPILEGPASGAMSLEKYFLYWAQNEEGNLDQYKCLVVKLGAEVCDLSEGMRGVMLRGTAQIIERIAACIERGILDGSVPPGKDPSRLAEALYQLWLGASLRAKVTKDDKPFAFAFEMARSLLA